MAELSTVFAGIASPNPFWLASGPPANSGDQVKRAFDAGWGGAVWKTIGEPAVEVMTDRPVERSLDDIREVKRLYPRNPVIVSVVAAPGREAWLDIVQRAEDTGCDAVELNFGGPHAVSAIGQSPRATARITGWVKQVARVPVLVKLTPNVADIRHIGQAARDAGADGLTAISTLHSIAGVDLDTFELRPSFGGSASRTGYGGPAVKPIALHMVRELAEVGLPVAGVGGISTWRDAVEFMLLGATAVQVCSAAMQHGYRIVEDMVDGLSNWMDERGFRTLDDFRGLGLANANGAHASHRAVAQIDAARCIGCELCYVACRDGAYQCIELPETDRPAITSTPAVSRVNKAVTPPQRVPYVDPSVCPGCNLCAMVCPVPGCITMAGLVHAAAGC